MKQEATDDLVAAFGWVAQEREIFPSLYGGGEPHGGPRPGRWDVAAANRRFPRLAERRHNMRDHLSDGEQQLPADQASLVRLIGLNLSAPTG